MIMSSRKAVFGKVATIPRMLMRYPTRMSSRESSAFVTSL